MDLIVNFTPTGMIPTRAMTPHVPVSVNESGGGLIYETDDELVDAMDSLMENISYRDELGLLGHQAYKELWTAEAHVKQYLELISNISDSR